VNDINIHFTRAEFADRQQRARERMAELELDGILLFKFEDMYWLTGFDSDGFTIFGCMFLGIDGQLTHLARPADLGNAAYSSICEDIRSPGASGRPGQRRLLVNL
jgi:Xaa-Pro dipeptidase